MTSALRSARALLFDMDGVLVDTSASYRETIVQTTHLLGARWAISGPSASTGWVAALKRAGGFNNDWDLTLALLRGLARFGDHFDIGRYARSLAGAGGGPSAVDRLLGVSADARFQPLGEVRDTFQAIYLGPTLYREIEGRFPPVVVDNGLIDSERALVTRAVLDAVTAPAAIATGRPRAEAAHALTTFGLQGRFGAVVTHDDCVEMGQRGKPDPWCVVEAARRIGVRVGADVWYLGDTVDDVRAALAAGCSAAGVAHTDADAERLTAAGATVVACSVGELLAA